MEERETKGTAVPYISLFKESGVVDVLKNNTIITHLTVIHKAQQCLREAYSDVELKDAEEAILILILICS